MLSRSELKKLFSEHGLRYLGFVPLKADHKSFARFQQWISQGCHGEMGYLEKNSQFRLDPGQLEPGLDGAIILGLPYYHRQNAEGANIARYAVMDDYHKLMRRRAARAITTLKELIPQIKSTRITIDSAPLLERSLAAKTRRGFIGKNTCYIHPEYGSFLLLGEILLTAVSFPQEERHDVNPAMRRPEGGCGTCKRCQVFCPTGALDQDYRLDARLCLAYWTIEHRGAIPLKFWKYLSKYWFGCDICQNVCPYNRNLEEQDNALPLKSHLKNVSLAAVATMDQSFYEETFAATPLTRAKKQGLQRNALISLVVSDSPDVTAVLKTLRARRDNHPTVIATLEQVDLWYRSRQ